MPATLSTTKNLSANQVTSKMNWVTLTVSLEGTEIVSNSDAGIAETSYCG